MAVVVVVAKFHTFFFSFIRLADFDTLIGWCESVCVVKILPQKES